MDHPEFSDANYLLGAMVQSGAALVAIIGGLLGARYVSLHSEKNAVTHVLDQAREALTTAQRAEARPNDARLSAQAKAWVWERGRYRSVLISTDSAQLTAEAERIYGPRSPDAVYVARQLITGLANASADLDDGEVGAILDNGIENKLYWHEVKHKLPDPPCDDATIVAGVWRYLERIRHTQIVRATEGKNDLAALVETVEGEYREELQRISMSAKAEVDRFEDLLRDARGKTREAERLVTLQESRVDSLFAGESFKLSSQVLTFVMLATVVFPLIPMIPGFLVWDLWVKIVLVASFLLGILVLGRYFWAYGSYLAGKTMMPGHLWRLLWRLKKQPEA